MVDLWESIFTPGPTSTLLKAANVTFAALQLVLLALLVATYSIHFLVLSVISLGLWWSINWFAAELRVAQEHERREKAKTADAAAAAAREGTEDSDTEVEGAGKPQIVGQGEETLPVEPVEPKGELRHRGEVPGTQSSTEDEWEKVSEEDKEKSA